jgi:hypothetical protein
MWLSLLALAAFATQDEGIMGPNPGVHRLDGPATVCGVAFALRLEAGEHVDFREGPDFFLYYTTARDGQFLLYEGGHPQPHDDEVRIGQQWMIAIHDSREAEAKARSRVRDRLLMGQAYSEACPTGLVRPN